MKKTALVVIALLAFFNGFSQTKSNIKVVLNQVKSIEKPPFNRVKTENYAPKVNNKEIGIYKRDNTFDGRMSVDPFGLPYHGYLDFGNTEELVMKKNNKKPFPTVFRTNKKFKLNNCNYYLIPFFVGCANIYIEDILTSCNENGDVFDVLFVGQAGAVDIPEEDSGDLIFIRQWSINTKGEIIVYQLQPTSTEKIYFRTAPKIINLKRVDTTYKVDENGKFCEVSKKEYKPKDYKREELYEKAKNIWEGNEIPLL